MASDKITFNLDAPIELSPSGEGYLEGKLLIATPMVKGDEFAQSVIYVFAHNDYGAMGLIINKPIENVHYAALMQQIGINVSNDSKGAGRLFGLEALHGGPVEEYRGFVLHSNDYQSEDTIKNDDAFSVTSSVSILKDIASGIGPIDYLLAVGYAGWGAGQLESEILANSWITAPASSEVIFDAEATNRWDVSAKSLGVDMARFSSATGRA